MKIILTGQPQSGKSTLLSKVINTEKEKYGFLTKEIIEKGQRIGFRIYESSGKTMILAQVKNPSNYKVGKYFVEIIEFERFINELDPVIDNCLIYIDEIGQMQLFSEKFVNLVEQCLARNNDFIGTMTNIFNNEITKKIKSRDDIILINISEFNRNNVEECLFYVLKNRNAFDKLSLILQKLIVSMANRYLVSDSFDSCNKLFNNAINYYIEGKVSSEGDGKYKVVGNHGTHVVDHILDNWTCDCPLFLGKSPFTKKSECSHIQSTFMFIEAKS